MGRGGVSPSHFFYDMGFAEAAAYLRGLESRTRNEWERVRVILGGLGKEIKLPWDNSEPVEIDEKELEELRKRAKEIKL